jgi:hypothetical protein
MRFASALAEAAKNRLVRNGVTAAATARRRPFTER